MACTASAASVKKTVAAVLNAGSWCVTSPPRNWDWLERHNWF